MPVKRLRFGIVILVLLTSVAYLPSLSGQFVWDDDVMLTQNPLIHARDGLFKFWFTTEPLDYFPMTYTSLWCEWRLWKMNPVGYRVVNLMLHILNGLLVWWVLDVLGIPGSFWAGLIFAVHPVNVASVAWITERKNTLSMFFYLISILLFVRSESDRSRSHYVLSLSAFILAALSKTSVVMLPVVMVFYIWWRRGRIEVRDLVRTIPFWAVSLVLGGVTVWFQTHRAMQEDVVSSRGFLERLLGATWAVGFYLIKSVAPFKLGAMYWPWQVDASHVMAYLPGLALLVAAAAAWHFRESWGRGALFAVGYMTVTLFPVLGFFPMAFAHLSQVADHWHYLSILGPIALVGACVERGFGRRIGGLRISVLMGIAVAAFLSVGTWARAAAYKDAESLWSGAVAANPRAWGAHYNLGVTLMKQGRIDLAVSHFRQAVGINPGFAEAQYNLGLALLSEGEIAEGVSHLEESVSLKQGFPEAHYALAVAYARQDKSDRAVEQLRDAVRLRPDYAEAYYRLGVHLESEGESVEAVENLTHAVTLRPEYAEAHVLLGRVLARQGRTEEAKGHYRSALRSKPDLSDAHTRLAACLADEGRDQESLQHYLEAIRLNPGDLEAHNNVAWLLATDSNDGVRDGRKALEHARIAVALSHGEVPTVLGTLAAAYAENGRFAEAVESAKKALAMAQAASDAAAINDLRVQLRAYERGRAYRPPPHPPNR